VGDAQWLDLALLKTVRSLNGKEARKLTFGQIYMHLLRTHPQVPPIPQCVLAVNALVMEGLLVSDRVLDEDPAFPYAQHIISGLTEVGVASLEGKEKTSVLVSMPQSAIAWG
jgi:hypothetical protein